VQELAVGDGRAIERAHDLTDVDSGPAIIPLAEANGLGSWVRVRAPQLLRPVSPHLVLAVQPASVVVGPVDVVADHWHQGRDVLAVVGRIRLE
jgi:hypothetical protein